MSLTRRNVSSCVDRPTWPAIIVLFSTLYMAGAAIAANATSAGDTELFNRLDANRDGVLTAGEMTSENRTLFERLLRRGEEEHDKSPSRAAGFSARLPRRAGRPA